MGRGCRRSSKVDERCPRLCFAILRVSFAKNRSDTRFVLVWAKKEMIGIPGSRLAAAKPSTLQPVSARANSVTSACV